MVTMIEPNNLGDILFWEEERGYSRDRVTVLSGQDLSMGEVVGKTKTSVPVTGTADAGNTGDGLCASVLAGNQVKEGVYTLTCIAEAANAGTFEVKDPEGNLLADATVAVAYVNEQISFTIADGAEDFDTGDIFTITVTLGSEKIVAIDFTAVNGTEDAAGFVIAAYDASAADVEGVIIAREALITTDNLVWPDGATADQKTAALKQLHDLGIIQREVS